MLDALGITLGDGLGHAKSQQKRLHQFMASTGLLGKFAAFRSQEDGPVRTGLDQAFALQAGKGADNRHVADAQRPRELDHAGFALGSCQFGDGLNIVLGDLACVGRPNGLVGAGGGVV